MDEDERANWTERLQHNLIRGRFALEAMETHLTEHAWFGSDTYSIADIALFAYTHVADDSGFDLARYPAMAPLAGESADTTRLRGNDDRDERRPPFIE